MEKRRKEGRAPKKRKRTPGRRLTIGSEAPRPSAWIGGLGASGPKKRHKTKTKGGLTTGNGELVRLMRDLL